MGNESNYGDCSTDCFHQTVQRLSTLSSDIIGTSQSYYLRQRVSISEELSTLVTPSWQQLFDLWPYVDAAILTVVMVGIIYVNM